MNKTDVLTGKIVQRVLNEINVSNAGKVSVVHGVNDSHDIGRLVNNLFKHFPDSSITLKKLKFGYELKIGVNKNESY